MEKRGFASTQIQIILAVIGIVLIGFVVVNTGVFQQNDTSAPAAAEENKMEKEDKEEIPVTTETPNTTPTQTTPQPSPTTPPPQTTPPASGQEPETTTPAPETSEPEFETIPQPYNPGFLASSRITPEIPSENERATLPSCEGKQFTFDVVNTAVVTSIDSNRTFNAGDPATFVWLSLPTNTELEEFDVVAPQDVWITHLTQQIRLTQDNEDDTIYFALCKDVFGYVTHIKELADNTRDVLTDSTCFGKPHVGENACLIETLELVSQGSLLGKAGRIEGRFGLGVIDLRKERGLQNASQYSVKTNFAVCPFDYFSNPSRYYEKLSSSNELCTQPQ